MIASKWGILSVSLVLICCIAWVFWPGKGHGQLDPKLVPIQQQMRKLHDSESGLTDTDRDRIRGELREQIDALAPEERHQLFASGREEMHRRMQQMMEARLDEFFTAPPGQRNAVLDRHIGEMEQRMRDMEQRRREWQQRRATDGSPSAGRNGWRPVGPEAGQGHPPRPDRGFGPTSDAQRRAESRRRRLDATSPEQRARFSEYMRELQKRRKQLGLPDVPIGPRRRG